MRPSSAVGSARDKALLLPILVLTAGLAAGVLLGLHLGKTRLSSPASRTPHQPARYEHHWIRALGGRLAKDPSAAKELMTFEAPEDEPEAVHEHSSCRPQAEAGVPPDWARTKPLEFDALRARGTPCAAAGEDMPSVNEGPWMTNWTNSVAVCVIVKEENVTDVREWLMYHRWLGVSKVFMHEHFTDSPIMDHPALAKLKKKGFVGYTQVNTTANQRVVYDRCLREHRREFSWLAFIDIDEFILIRDRGKGALPDFLDEYKHYPGLSMSWIIMGWNKRKTRPEHGGVLRHYTKCNPTPSGNMKTIVNTFFAIDGGWVHNFRFRGYAGPVNENHVMLHHYCAQDKKRSKAPWADYPSCVLRSKVTLPVEDQSVERVALFHYFSRSLEDYQLKMQKGRADKTQNRTMEVFDRLGKHDQVRALFCEELTTVANDCCPDWKGSL